MPLTHLTLRNSFAKFWKNKKHVLVPSSPIVPKDDPTTLFTSSGMQQLIPYLSGEKHPSGKRLYNIQPCFRATDIEGVGNSRHTTFFEMMGNWSLGDYFKEEQLEWCWDFFTKELNLPQERLYVTVFEGNKEVAKDEESTAIWKKLGVAEDHIFYYGADKNWWSRAGTPEEMPAGEIGGPDSEVFYEFDIPHNKKFGEKCHPNCDCGRFLEIGNSVFIMYRKKKDGSLEELAQKNVDYGGGLERILAAANNQPDIFQTDVFSPIIEEIEKDTKLNYSENKGEMQIIADHLKAAVFMIVEGLVPSNKEQGYILRHLLRRAAVKMYEIRGRLPEGMQFSAISETVLKIYDGVYFDLKKDSRLVSQVVSEEISRFSKSLDRGLGAVKKIETIDGKMAFDLYQSYGFPLELTEEIFRDKGQVINKKQFKDEFEKHKELSRTASVGKFKGGLADHSEQVLKYHTATHLLHQAIRDVLGEKVRQEGSNITAERLRFDFSYDRKPTDEEIKKVEEIINQKIKDALPVRFEIMPKDEADKIGALSFFKEKYADKVKVYFVGDYSKEFCGGPHVQNTSEIGEIKITKVEKIGANLIRVYVQ